MTPVEILDKCVEQQRLQDCPDATVTFVIRGSWGKRNTRRLWRGGPVGEILSDFPDGQMVVSFKADEVIAALGKMLPEAEHDH